MLDGTKEAQLHVGYTEFCIHLDQKLVPRAHDTPWKSLAPFQIFSGVDSVQRIINR